MRRHTADKMLDLLWRALLYSGLVEKLECEMWKRSHSNLIKKGRLDHYQSYYIDIWFNNRFKKKCTFKHMVKQKQFFLSFFF